VTFTVSGTGSESPTSDTVATTAGVVRFTFTSTATGHSTIAATAGSITNTAGVDWLDPAPDMSVSVNAPTSASSSGAVNIGVQISASGQTPPTGATLAVTLPTGVTPTAVQPGMWTCDPPSGAKLACRIGAMISPGFNQVQFQAVMGAAGTATIKATVTPDNGPDLHPSDNTAQAHITVTSSPPTVPSSPTAVAATAGDSSAVVTWQAPVSNGGSAVTGYTLRSQPATATLVVGAAATSTPVAGLQNGTTYTFTVTADNAAGHSTPSASNAVTPNHPSAGPGSAPGTGDGTPSGAVGDAGRDASRSGYWMLGAAGAVYHFGDTSDFGQPTLPAGTDAVALEPTPSSAGYWILDSAGVVHPYGNAAPLGNLDRHQMATGEAVSSLSATPSGAGYWIFTTRGRVIPFGDAGFFGDMSAVALNGPVLGSIPTPTGRGYYMVASDGGIFAFGDATFHGSMGGKNLNAPVQSLVPDGDGGGYWLVASDGGIFAFGDAPFRGSMGGTKLNKPVKGMVRYGNGYLMVASDGGIFSFSDKAFAGSLGGNPPARPIVAVAAAR
jgi:Fibronectin type III domain